MAANVATMIGNNGSVNCNAAKILITSPQWGQRDAFLAELLRQLARLPSRRAYYPAPSSLPDADRRPPARDLRRGNSEAAALDADPQRRRQAGDDPRSATNRFCAILSDVTLGSADRGRVPRPGHPLLHDTLWARSTRRSSIHRAREGPAVGACSTARSSSCATARCDQPLAGDRATPRRAPGAPRQRHPRRRPSGLGWSTTPTCSRHRQGRDPRSAQGVPDATMVRRQPKGSQLVRRLIALEADPSWRRARVALRAV